MASLCSSFVLVSCQKDHVEEIRTIDFEHYDSINSTHTEIFSLMCGVSCFQWFTEDSDELWMRHCQRDFKRETPQEYESWRELYLRLHDEREERLRLLTQNISSAHANKPKGSKDFIQLGCLTDISSALVFIYKSFTSSASWCLRVFILAGRQVKMAFVNSVAKPPRDVRRRQEKFGTTGGLSTAASTVAASPIKSVLTFCFHHKKHSK